MRPIDADSFRQFLQALYNIGAPYEGVIELLDKENTIEAVPVVHGEWVAVTNGRGGHECSICHNYAPSYANGEENISNFCSNCGAKMKGGTE